MCECRSVCCIATSLRGRSRPGDSQEAVVHMCGVCSASPPRSGAVAVRETLRRQSCICVGECGSVRRIATSLRGRSRPGDSQEVVVQRDRGRAVNGQERWA